MESVRSAVGKKGASQFELDCAETLAGGLERLAKGDIDVVLLSLALPDSQGLDALSRTVGQAPTVPIIVLTNFNNENLALQTLRTGAQDYVLKEKITAHVLLRILRYTVERRRAVDEAKKVTRQLVSGLAHDIKNPLVVINVNAQLVHARLEPTDENRENLELLEHIQENVRRVVKMIEGFLDVSKSETHKVEPVRASVQLNDVIRDVYQLQAGEIALKNISLNLNLDGELPEIMGDRAQLERVMWNLFSNAIKYTPSGGSVTVSSFCGGSEACVAVQDTGIGIPRDEQSSLFKEFRRLRGALHLQGIGLGLFIVRTIVEAHGGTVNVESEEGRGSTFTFRLPSKRP